MSLAVDNADRISRLPNDILLKILSKLPMEEAIRTSVLSKRWEDVWKKISFIFFDMQKVITINGIVLPQLLDRAATQITKLINNHNGYLETCIIFHYSYQAEDGTLESWIQSLTMAKHTNNLILVNCDGRLLPTVEANVLKLSPKKFAHPDLKSLSLCQYILHSARAFKNCRNIKILKLDHIIAEVGVFNKVISSCPSLEVLILQIFFFNPNGHLKIDHKKLRILLMSCNQINGVEVCASHLDIFFTEYILCESDNVIFETPRLPFSRNYWVAGRKFPHTSVNILCPDQENENNGMVMTPFTNICVPASFSVSVDLKNPREVELLQKILVSYTAKMIELEIFFKNNNPLREEEGSSNTNSVAQDILLEKIPFPNDSFRVDTIWMYNFNGSNPEEFLLASHFVMQMTVVKKMMIRTPAFPGKKKTEIEDAVAKLNKLQKGNKELSIECF